MIDAPTVLRDFLLAKSPIFALTGSRIWGERTNPIEGYLPSQGSAICFRTRGGRPDYTGQILTQSWPFKCYGIDEDAARLLYRTLFDVMQDAQGAGIYHIENEVSGQLWEEPILKWPFVISYWTVLLQRSFVPVP